MKHKHTKFWNDNILKSLVTTAAPLCILGIALSYLYNSDPYNLPVEKIFINYLYISVGVMTLVYIAQVFFLQKPTEISEDIGEEDILIPDKDFDNGSVKVFLFVGAILILIDTKFGSIGSTNILYILDNSLGSQSYATQNDSLMNITNFVSVVFLAAIIMLSLIALVVRFSSRLMIILIVLTAIFCSVISPHVISQDYVLIYFFALYSGLKKFDLRLPEALFLAVSSLIYSVTIIIYLMSSLSNLFINDVETLYHNLIYTLVISVACGIVLIFAWKKNSMSLIVVGFALYILNYILRNLFYFIDMYQNMGMGLNEFGQIIFDDLGYYLLPDGMTGINISSMTVVFAIAIIRQYRLKNRPMPGVDIDSLSVKTANATTYKSFVAALVIVIIVIAVNYGVLIYQYINTISDLYSDGVY